MNNKEQYKLMYKLLKITDKIEQHFLIRVIRDGLITMIPVLMIGAFALVLKTFPLYAYQSFITSFAGGILSNFFHMIYMCTFGVMSVYMTLSFSVSLFSLKNPEKAVNIWGVFTALVSYLILIGVGTEDFSTSNLGATSVFLAIVSAMASSQLFIFISEKISAKKIIYSYGADSRLNSTVNAMLPATITILAACAISCLVSLAGKGTLHELMTNTALSVFGLVDSLFAKGFLFVLVLSILWTAGIHGSDCLQSVSDTYFIPLLEPNIEAAAAGTAPPEILCKPFFDIFILMGGCGSSICLLIAILLFSRDKGMRDIAKTAGFPMIFNINELIVFGLPIVFNPVMFIPFVCVPLIQYLVAYAAISSGIVPPIISGVEWTTPVILSGYSATGSIAGSLLQVFNITLGVLIYTPFVKAMGVIRSNRENKNREAFVKWYIQNEDNLKSSRLTEIRSIYGEIAKRMALEMKAAIKQEVFKMYYQPQYNYEGKCIGVEALLR